MIYLVSNKISPPEGVESMSVEDSIAMVSKWPVVQFDTETTGLDARICNLTSMQFGYKNLETGEHTEIVVDCTSVDPKLYKHMIEHSYIIGHNLKFDLKFLYNYEIVPLNVYDTMICEQTLYLGYSPGQVTYSLHDILQRYTGIDLDKSYQKVISRSGLTAKGIIYAAHDVEYLQDIRKAQVLQAKSRKCEKAFLVENRFVPAIAYLEWCGIHLDENKWKAKMDSDNQKLQDCLDNLNNYVVNHTELNKQFVSDYTQLSLFETTTTEGPQCSVNWDSPAKVVPVFQTLGFDTKTVDKKTHKVKDTVEENQISNQKGVNDEFLSLYLDYKGAKKTTTSYGQGHLNLINPKTGRLHTEFRQFGTVTGRMACGGKDGENSLGKKNEDLAALKGINPDKVRYVNLQNLPSRGEEGKITRACFTATEGNVFVSCDYSAEESRVQADVWNEKKLLDSFAQGIDTHNLYAKMCYPEELKDVNVHDVKSVRPDLRQNAKYFEFELAYGGNGTETAKKLGLDKEVAMQNVANVLKEMPGMVNYKKKTVNFLKTHGYIVINELTGHRIYWPQWPEWRAVEDRYDRHFWEEYNMFHKGTGDEVNRQVRAHMEMSSEWFNKNVLNYPIQGGSAIVLKQAAADLFEWVVKNKYFGKILFCVFVHDELDCECPAEIGDMVAEKICQIMKKASAKFYHRLEIPADSSIGDHWIH